MSRHDEHPDEAAERRRIAEDEQAERDQQRELVARHAPPPRNLSRSRPNGRPTLSTPMVVLAWTVLNGPDHDRRDAAKALAQEILEADQAAR